MRAKKKPDQSNATRPFVERVQLAIFLSVFVIAFGAVAGIFGAFPIAQAITTACRASSLIEVPATIKDVRLDLRGRRTDITHSLFRSDKPTHLKSLSARYSYAWKGVTYQSAQISVQHWAGWHDRASWHEEWFARLEQARKSQTPVSAWVSVEAPSEAVLDREVRWARLWLAIPLLILFGAVSLFSGVHLVRVLFGIDRKRLVVPSAAHRASVK
jgi:Protein of unknown function (DUF3592)